MRSSLVLRQTEICFRLLKLVKHSFFRRRSERRLVWVLGGGRGEGMSKEGSTVEVEEKWRQERMASARERVYILDEVGNGRGESETEK